MGKSRLPFFSKPVVSCKAPSATNTFGFTWQEVVTRVEAIGIVATDKILVIQNHTHDETRASLTKYMHNMGSHMFLLHPGEYITKVEVCYTEAVVTALKLYTTKRVTPWYGQTNRWRVTLKADDGLCINAFRGKYGYGPESCSELGVVFAPKAIADEGHSATLPAVTVKRAVRDDDAAFARCTVDLAPRAVMVTTSTSEVQSVRVLTAIEYDRIVRFANSFQYAPGEQWLVLAEGERIEAVGVKVERQVLVAIAFKTSLHTSHLFGSDSLDETHWLTSDAMDLESYLAFDANDTDSKKSWMTRFAVLTTKPSGEATGSQQASKAALATRAHGWGKCTRGLW